MNLIRNHLNLSQLIPSLSTRIPNLTPNRLSLTPLIPSLSTRIPNLTHHRLNLTPWIPTQSNRIQTLLNLTQHRPNLTPQTQLRPSQFRPNKRTDKRKRGLRGTKETLNEGISLTPLLNRQALSPIVRGWKLACFQFDLPARTRPASARMRRFFVASSYCNNVVADALRRCQS